LRSKASPQSCSSKLQERPKLQSTKPLALPAKNGEQLSGAAWENSFVEPLWGTGLKHTRFGAAALQRCFRQLWGAAFGSRFAEWLWGAVLVNRLVESQLWGNSFGEQLWGTALGSSAGKGFGEQLWEAALRKLFPKAACFPKLLSKAPPKLQSNCASMLLQSCKIGPAVAPQSCSSKLLAKAAP